MHSTTALHGAHDDSSSLKRSKRKQILKRLSPSFIHPKIKAKSRNYCICNGTNSGRMISCDMCLEWYHYKCISLEDHIEASVKSKKDLFLSCGLNNCNNGKFLLSYAGQCFNKPDLVSCKHVISGVVEMYKKGEPEKLSDSDQEHCFPSVCKSEDKITFNISKERKFQFHLNYDESSGKGISEFTIMKDILL